MLWEVAFQTKLLPQVYHLLNSTLFNQQTSSLTSHKEALHVIHRCRQREFHIHPSLL